MFTEELASTTTGVRLNTARGLGHGPPLLLLHGLGRRWADFSPLLPALAAGWTVWAMDHRGHGRSDRAGSYLVADYVADAASVVASHAEPPVLVGHSLGALVALGVAAQLGDAVRAVVLLDPPGPGFLARIGETSYAAVWEGMRRLAGGQRPIPEIAHELAEVRLPGDVAGETIRLGNLRDAAAIRFMARCLHHLDPAAMTPPLEGRWLAGFDLLLTASAVRCPALLVVADPARGGMLPASDATPLTAAIRDCTRVDLPGVGHLVHWQDVPATLRVVLSFLGSV